MKTNNYVADIIFSADLEDAIAEWVVDASAHTEPSQRLAEVIERVCEPVENHGAQYFADGVLCGLHLAERLAQR